jgi:beta-galactosidase/beta-glucuronidase
LLTQWAREVTPDKALPEYPRPQMLRANWLNLNGLWDYALSGQAVDHAPTNFDGSILVPFCIESALSGVMKALEPDQRLWYHRTFTVPADWAGQRILLHFGAVDYDSTVWLNGKLLGSHIGGYDGFTYDVTDSLESNRPQELVVSVYDATIDQGQVRSKQVLRAGGGANYTACSGIWQTVWLEPVPKTSIRNIVQVTDIDTGALTLTVEVKDAAEGDQVEAVALDGPNEVALARAPAGGKLILAIPNARLWWPDQPFLYDLKVSLLRDGHKADAVGSYFGMRKVSLVNDAKGFARIHINNKYLIQVGVLDQGYWPDGIYTAPTDDALRYDLEVMKQLKLLVSRKHVKVEPERWYYWADKLGILVWQDMPNQYNTEGDRIVDRPKSGPAARQFEKELPAMVEGHRNHPSIIMWTLFNEAWGQYDSYRLTRWIKGLDPTRLVNTASGFVLKGCGDVMDSHGGVPPYMPGLAMVTSETAGFGVVMKEHSWMPARGWAYGAYRPGGGGGGGRGAQAVDWTPEAKAWCTDRTVSWIRDFHREQVADGRTGSIKVQLTDVETECNGLLTYDRAIIKVDVEKVAAAGLDNSGNQ